MAGDPQLKQRCQAHRSPELNGGSVEAAPSPALRDMRIFDQKEICAKYLKYVVLCKKNEVCKIVRTHKKKEKVLLLIQIQRLFIVFVLFSLVFQILGFLIKPEKKTWKSVLCSGGDTSER